MTPVQVVALVCARLGVPVARIHDTRGPGAITRGPRAVVEARAVACWILRLRGLSYPAIGRVVGRHHSSVMHLVTLVDGATLDTAIELAWEVEAGGSYQRAL